MYFFKNLLLYSGAWFIQTKCMVMLTEELSTKFVNFMTPGVGILVQGSGHISHMVKMHNLFKNLLFTQASIKQTVSIVMMTKEKSTKIVNFMKGEGVLVLGHGHIVKMQFFFSLSCLHCGMDQTNKVYSNDDQNTKLKIS